MLPYIIRSTFSRRSFYAITVNLDHSRFVSAILPKIWPATYAHWDYHPVIRGDILGLPSERSDSESRRYRIMHKLGFGPHATVCLAERTDCRTAFVAVKITTAEYSQTTRVTMPEATYKNNKNPSHIVSLLDHFTNDTHSNLVMDVAASMAHFWAMPARGFGVKLLHTTTRKV
ncbi:hypothetical protein K443DRAFT_11729 [Laccaria amethystina LaAM-08-1]|uniref:Unplaced genomic scaffold K443scaffold_238, whole genome shotgun sequence n=1 Tax=Laccaria amethystina LaAM-08-1 TaxID=1095629 RepID=A0A0C9XFP1_9AGAR|nr:hypothetical protein K443DRAFT_11729 [Laccaria amethystina LaAM-08-1]